MKSAYLWATVLQMCLWAPLSAQPLQTAAGQPGQAEGGIEVEQEPIPKVYTKQADAGKEIAQALRRAQKEHKRVLVQFGANWCHWCLKLHQLFNSNYKISRQLRNEYEVVHVDIGSFDKNLDLVKKYQAPLQEQGVPYLVVLDERGKVVQRQETSSLEKGKQHDPQAVLAFLLKYQAPRLDAFTVFESAKAKARKSGKALFFHIGAPWCTWCHQLEGFLALPRIDALLGKDFVLVKIDQDRMTHSKKLIAKFRPKSSVGIPWYAVFSSEGKLLLTSDGPKGNAGCPVEVFEIQHFMKMISLGAAKLSEKELAEVEATLLAYGKKFRSRQ
jgi:thiol-disulfide isomerase/thioredoxin